MAKKWPLASCIRAEMKPSHNGATIADADYVFVGFPPSRAVADRPANVYALDRRARMFFRMLPHDLA